MDSLLKFLKFGLVKESVLITLCHQLLTNVSNLYEETILVKISLQDRQLDSILGEEI